MTLERRYAQVAERVAAAARRAGRNPDDVTIVAVSKTVPIDVVAAARDAGIRDLGENRAQELREKALALGEGICWHFIGHLQNNQVRYVVGVADLVHSVDRYGVAETISRRAGAVGMTQDVLIEVNVAGERSKQGVEPPRAIPLALEVNELPGVRVVGLMTVPPLPDSPEGSRPYYSDLAALGQRLRAEIPAATHLSMGMTRDFEVAVEEGASIVRVGEAIFGPRSPAR